MKSIKDQLREARKNKTQLKTKVDGDIVATWQIANRERVIYSEMSLYVVENKRFIVLHKNKQHPNPEKVLLGAGDFSVQAADSYVFNTILSAIIAYRESNLEEEYVNTYSYLSGWCLSKEVNIHKVLDI